MRNIFRHRGAISAAKFAIERALEILKERLEALLLYTQTQADRATISEEVDQCWNEMQGDKHETDALETITALDTQLMMDEAIETSLRPQITDNIANATAALTLSTSPLRNNSAGDQSLDADKEKQHRLSSELSTTSFSSPFVHPIQLRKLERSYAISRFLVSFQDSYK
ncbi:unnamed protein product [Haemonchus placei]|uniref:IQ motif, EF-hand binding site n=1 Tax=Haemonchus placei TaxID=6290 RepID=A0A0N4X0S9_HAEPC|nr:unnamed protein product [Haemonchus placei]